MFLDVNIGDADGFELLFETKKKDSNSQVVITTGEDTETNREKALRGGAYTFNKKPFEFLQLSQIVKNSSEDGAADARDEG